MTQKTILITGSSSGIGLELTVLAARQGHRVFATMRSPDKAIQLKEKINQHQLKIELLQCDVTDEKSIVDCVAEVERRAGRIDVLVNNAGYGLFAPGEIAPMDSIRRQFETNFFGLVSMCQKVLPIMRRQRAGRILNVGSIVGRLAIPMMGYYNATKFAVAGFTEALYFEMKPFGVDVVLIEPGRFKTDFGSRGLETVRPEVGSGYDQLVAVFEKRMAGNGNDGPPGIIAAKKILAVIETERPRRRYLVGWDAFFLGRMRSWVPDFMYEWAIRCVYLRGIGKL